MTTPNPEHMAELGTSSGDDARSLYARLIAAWNARDGVAFAACFVADGSVVGFDGSVVSGRDAIARHLTEIFANHQTPAYVTKVSEVRSRQQPRNSCWRKFEIRAAGVVDE